MTAMFESEQVPPRDFALQKTNTIFFFIFYFRPQMSSSERTTHRALSKEDNKFLQDIWGSQFLEEVPETPHTVKS